MGIDTLKSWCGRVAIRVAINGDFMEDITSLLCALTVNAKRYHGRDLRSVTPITGDLLMQLRADTTTEVKEKIGLAVVAFEQWRTVPPPKRGELVRLFGEELRVHKNELGKLVTLETGKILQEGLGEVQEM